MIGDAGKIVNDCLLRGNGVFRVNTRRMPFKLTIRAVFLSADRGPLTRRYRKMYNRRGRNYRCNGTGLGTAKRQTNEMSYLTGAGNRGSIAAKQGCAV